MAGLIVMPASQQSGAGLAGQPSERRAGHSFAYQSISNETGFLIKEPKCPRSLLNYLLGPAGRAWETLITGSRPFAVLFEGFDFMSLQSGRRSNK